MSAQVVIVFSVALTALVSGEGHHATEISYPGNGACIREGLPSYQVDFQSIQVHNRLFTRYYAKDGSCITSSVHEVFKVHDKLDCAVKTSDGGYNSFTYLHHKCVAYTYWASACSVQPSPIRNKPNYEIYIVDKKKLPYGPEVINFQWKNSPYGKIRAYFHVIGLCNVHKIRIDLVNGTSATFKPTPKLDAVLNLDTDFCTGQDMTITLEDRSGRKLFKHTYLRERCHGEDLCHSCASKLHRMDMTRSDDEEYPKFTYSGLVGQCPKDESPPVIQTENDRDMVMTFIENSDDMPSGDFWVSYKRNSTNSFQWPNGSADLSVFGNGDSFNPTSGEDCAVASMELVSMQLMIFPRTCTEQEYGFCFQ